MSSERLHQTFMGVPWPLACDSRQLCEAGLCLARSGVPQESRIVSNSGYPATELSTSFLSPCRHDAFSKGSSPEPFGGRSAELPAGHPTGLPKTLRQRGAVQSSQRGSSGD